jgi:hypothetical protein
MIQLLTFHMDIVKKDLPQMLSPRLRATIMINSFISIFAHVINIKITPYIVRYYWPGTS